MIEVEHELHHRRRGRNIGVGLLLGAFIAIVFGLTVAKVLALGDANKFRSFDHVAEPEIVPEAVTE